MSTDAGTLAPPAGGRGAAEGRQLGWPAWTFILMGAAAPALAAFVGYELRKTHRDGSPLVELRMFRQRGFAVGMAIALVFFLGVASFGLVLTLFLQLGLGFTPLHAGLTFVPFSLGVFVASGAARLEPKFGRGVTMSGALIIAAGMAALIGIVHHYGAGVTGWELAPGMAMAGLGLGTVIAPLANVVLAGVRMQDAGSASGVLNTGFQLGGSIGLALIGVIFFGFLGTQASPAAASVAPGIRAELSAAGVPAQATGRIVGQFRDCLHDRLVASDPTVTPPSCRTGGTAELPAAAAHGLVAASTTAVERDFAATVERTLWYQVGVFVLAFLLMLGLPARRAVPGKGRRATGADTGTRGTDADAIVHGSRGAGQRPHQVSAQTDREGIAAK